MTANQRPLKDSNSISLKVIAAVAAVAASGVALPALTSAQSSGGREITVREKVQSIRFVHQKRA